MIDPKLFELSVELEIRFEPIADGLPVLLVDNLYARPDEIREQALQLTFGPPPDPYPGRIAVSADADGSLHAFLRWAMDLANRAYLPRLERRIGPLTQVHSDFAIVDFHPDELAGHQRVPHVDPVPIFGLVYLNREERGGTLFFRRSGNGGLDAPSPDYLTQSRDGFELAGRIEPAFNRLAIYPGFVPHSGEIAGDWIRSDERFTSPRLTQRLLFG